MIDPKKVIDISMDLNEKTVVWKDDAQPELRPMARIPEAGCNFTWLSFGSHAGTHIDAPYYLFNNKWTCDQVPFERLIGRCQVIDLTDVECTITEERLKECDISNRIVLLKTRNSYDKMESYNPKLIDMTPKAARYLISKEVTTLGYDYQSFEREGRNDLHLIFLEKSITLIDNLRLRHVKQGDYTLICLPLKVTGIDGAPARAVLIEEE
ncbi:MAG: cyclase family protein [Candidatus Woesearchaeota archaeon]